MPVKKFQDDEKRLADGNSARSGKRPPSTISDRPTRHLDHSTVGIEAARARDRTPTKRNWTGQAWGEPAWTIHSTLRGQWQLGVNSRSRRPLQRYGKRS